MSGLPGFEAAADALAECAAKGEWNLVRTSFFAGQTRAVTTDRSPVVCPSHPLSGLAVLLSWIAGLRA